MFWKHHSFTLSCDSVNITQELVLNPIRFRPFSSSLRCRPKRSVIFFVFFASISILSNKICQIGKKKILSQKIFPWWPCFKTNCFRCCCLKGGDMSHSYRHNIVNRVHYRYLCHEAKKDDRTNATKKNSASW